MFEVQKNTQGVQWFNKMKTSGMADTDVTISVIKQSHGKTSIGVTFRDKVWTKFKSDYVLIGIDGSRLCFMPGDRDTGYKLSDPGASFSRYIKSTNTVLAEWAKYHKGDYPLEYNAEEKYWFVETERS